MNNNGRRSWLGTEVHPRHAVANQQFDPDEPRVSAGRSGGGQWAKPGTSDELSATGKLAGSQSSQAIQKVETKEQEAKWKTEGEYPTGDARFDKFIKFIFAHENVLNEEGKVIPENQVGDSGGLTKYGIDRSSHPDVDVAGLNKEKATAIYFAEWKKLGISK